MKRRIFAAVEISDEARRKTSDYIETLRRNFSQIRVGWEKPEKLHLTVKFLGDVEENKLADLIEAAEQTAQKLQSLKLQIAETGVFPSLRQPRILWLGVQDETDDLKKVNASFESHCEKIGFAREQRIYKSHLTIARLREPKTSVELANVHWHNKFSSLPFSVQELVIFESQLTQFGSHYRVLHRTHFHKFNV